MSTPNIRPDRTNWRQFCQEQPLSTEENKAWREMVDASEADDTGELSEFIYTAIVEMPTMTASGQAEEWAGLAQWSDAWRRKRRVALAAWARWQEQELAR